MRQSKARRERHERRREYEWQLASWQRCKPAWWQFIARCRWKARKPIFQRRA